MSEAQASGRPGRKTASTAGEHAARRAGAYGGQTVTGVVVNETPNRSRPDYDRLRAELHRLGRQDSVDLGLRDVLLGRLAWAQQFVVPSRMARLQRLFNAIPFVQ
jgi:RNA-directed DNA polymerase